MERMTMARPGYVYAITGPSHQGMIKIGLTTKTPEERAKELSSDPSCPEPLEVVHAVYVNDCREAEKYLHVFFERNGVRVSPNREWFGIAPEEAIAALDEVANSALGVAPGHSGLTQQEHDGHEQFQRAQALYHGEGDELEDHKEALTLFEQAARLGHGYACYLAGHMFRVGQRG